MSEQPHCETCRCGERCPIQESHGGGIHRRPQKSAGTVARWEAEQAYAEYAAAYGHSQSLDRLNERGGFGYWELTDLLGHEPTTWRTRVS